MRRIFNREEPSEERKNIEQKIISVIGIGRGAGTTTVATSLAFFFSKKGESVTFIEGTKADMANNLLYAGVAMEQRFNNRTFYDFYKLVKDGYSVKGVKNMEEGINWILVTLENIKDKIELSKDEINQLVISGSSEKIILDITDNTGWEEILVNSDYIVAVIDPLPSKLIANVETYRKIRKLQVRGTKVIWVVNKYNKGVSRSQIKDYIKSGNIVWIDQIPSVKMYSEEFGCKFHWNNDEIKSKVMEMFTKVSH